MNPNQLFWIWLIVGGVLMVAELVIPGLITVFLGIAGVIIALGYKLGLLSEIIPGIIIWFILSLFLVFVLRELIQKWMPGESRHKEINEDTDAFGSIVEVIEDIRIEDSNGRIKFRGTTWQATTSAPLIEKGSKAKIITRDNLVWIVEPYVESLLDSVSNDKS